MINLLQTVLLHEETTIEWLQNVGLLKREMICDLCNKPMKLQEGADVHWNCTLCSVKKSVRSNSVFFRSNLSLKQLILLIYHFWNKKTTKLQECIDGYEKDVGDVFVIELSKKIHEISKDYETNIDDYEDDVNIIDLTDDVTDTENLTESLEENKRQTSHSSELLEGETDILAPPVSQQSYMFSQNESDSEMEKINYNKNISRKRKRKRRNERKFKKRKRKLTLKKMKYQKT
jgi:hypothetical protein